MNEKILEFAKQTGLCDEDGDFFGGKISQYDEFAELIIRECSGILRKEADSHWEGREGRLLKAMAGWIEQHFAIDK